MPLIVSYCILYLDESNLCLWCRLKPKEWTSYPCRHRAICESCCDTVNTCPKCREKPDAFLLFYNS